MPRRAEWQNPREDANLVSVIFFWWMNDVLKQGNKRPLTETDLFHLLEDYKAEVLVEDAEKYWFEELKRSQSGERKPRLWKAMVSLISWKSGLVMIILKILQSLSFVFLPLCLWLVLKTLNDGPNLDLKFAFMYVALLGTTSLIKALTTQHYDYLTELWGLKLKVALIGLVYKKVVSLSRCSLEATLSGNTINIVSNDAQKIEKSLNSVGYILSAPLEIVINLLILWYLIGWKALFGASFLVILVAFQILMTRKAARLRMKAATFTDKRLVIMNEIISGIRAVKMHAWEWNFRDSVGHLRRKEMAIIHLKGLIVSLLLVLYFTTIPIATLVSVTTLILSGAHLSSFAIFTLLLGFAMLRKTICLNLSLSMQIAADGKVALDRIQTFLTEKVTKFEGIKASNTQNQNPNSNCKSEKKTKMAVQLVSYRQRNDYLSKAQAGNGDSSSEINLATPGTFATSTAFKEPFVSISKASCSWNQGILTNTLSDITLNVRNGNLLAITGAVGIGKSSLLTAILGELSLHSGSILYRGKVAYVPQIPWVFSGTIRENILFGLAFNEERFQQVVHVCELTKDLANFANGDLTEIGQRGVTLSGGQKARVGLARAVYSDADIYLLDDPLSAVDTKVGRRLFESCIMGHLSGSIRLLVTHQLQYLKDVDRIVVMENGSISYQGKYAEIPHQGAFPGVAGLPEQCEDGPGLPETVLLDKINDNRITKKELERPSIPSIDAGNMPGIAQTPDLKLIEPVQDDKEIIDTQNDSVSIVSGSKGSAEGKDNASFIEEDNKAFRPDSEEKQRVRHELSEPVENGVNADKFRDEVMTKKLMDEPSVSFVAGQPDGHVNESFVDYLNPPEQQNKDVGVDIKDETFLQSTSYRAVSDMSDVLEADPEERPVLDLKEDEETKSAGTVTFRLYWNYFKEGLPVPGIMFLAVALLFAQVSLIAPNWWLSRMAEMSHDQQKRTNTHVIHGSLVALALVVMTISSFSFYYLLLKAAENLHSKLTVATNKAPVEVFDSTPAGRILNRFSKDIGSMDDVLPPLFLQALIFCLFSLSAILVPASTNYWLFLALLPIIGIFVYFARYYLRSSRELKRIEAIKCSPVYSHITETINGLEIVHASNMSKTFVDRLKRCQDENTQAFFMVVSSNRWLSVRLDLLASVFVTIVAVAAILVSDNPALAGLSLTYALQTLDVTQYGVRSASEVENLMTSVERVISYTKINSEPGYSAEDRPPESWPNEGSLTIKDLSLVYFEGGPRVLKDVNVTICSKEKVGVVGRTGAGKSSLVSALFRMPDPLGKVTIDGVDIGSINLQEARRSMAVITQDPVLFGGTLKRNIDPLSEYSDQDLWTALEEVHLKTLVEDLPGQLEFKLKESGTNLSVGERQLVCLARALVQKSKIIIMDEATANVDFKTDCLIQEVIRDKFKDSTVLTIAHRLNTIMDYDRVMVLDGGRVVEFDKPEALKRKGGLFAEMIRSQTQRGKA
ncbi:ATP-binding cassette sub-family C member 4-like [Montipora capricornis]|uniref:ATP-binding cassette sub-family C member 4-like n=1 Tax=Montipora capricornis TaxID=246305 RepID=UPI0035F1D0FA